MKALKIIVQYRTKRGKMYELQGAAGVLALCFGYAGEAADCIVEAGSPSTAGRSPVEGRGSTPSAALVEVARAWRADVPARAPFDWDAVTRALQAVQAV